ncbi:MAG: hypothetical protein QOC71_815 [Thermoplasmata archaeon]|nr:hypothetical protein [Thermoplasmata archaeon]
MGRAALQTDGLRLEEALQALEGLGFFTVFRPAPGGRIACAGCGQETSADEARVEAQHRIEGVSDPADNMLVVGLRCAGCNDRGTLVLPYGPLAGRDEVAVLRALLPMRRESP